VSIGKTQYESIEIEVLDKDPVRAKEMVEAVIELVNNKIRRIQKDKYLEVLEVNGHLLKKKEREIDSVKQVLVKLGTEHGLFEAESQAREVTEGYLRTIDGDARNINHEGVRKLKKGLEEKGGELLVNTTYVHNLMARYNEIKSDYERAYKDVHKEFTFTNTVTAPFVSDKKAYPVRWLIVLYAVVAAAVVSILVIAVVENKKSLEFAKDGQ
jgi:hypothetical protein